MASRVLPCADLLPAVRTMIRDCRGRRGCPLRVGTPLHHVTVANPERGEGVLRHKEAALAILDGLLGDGTRLFEPDDGTLANTDGAQAARLRALRGGRGCDRGERRPYSTEFMLSNTTDNFVIVE